MKITPGLILDLFLVLCVECTFGSRCNVGWSELINCKEYRAGPNHLYEKFFSPDEIRNNPEENERLRLKFYVIAARDAHILLSPVVNAVKADDVYEIGKDSGL